MHAFFGLLRRNIKMFFSDKALLVGASITPIILLGLYLGFFNDNIVEMLDQALKNFDVSKTEVYHLAFAQMISSLVAVCPVTIAFIANGLTVEDRIRGTNRDLKASPASPAIIHLAYFTASFCSTLIVAVISFAILLIFDANNQWFLPLYAVGNLFLDCVLLSIFSTALSSIVFLFLSSEGQMSIASSLVSAGYGFFAGAYMPIASLSQGVRDFISCLPGTYATILARRHALLPVIDKISADHAKIPDVVITSIKDSLDCNFSFFGTTVQAPTMLLVFCLSILALILLFLLLGFLRKDRA